MNAVRAAPPSDAPESNGPVGRRSGPSPSAAAVTVVVAAAAMVATLPGRTQGLGLITESLLADLDIDRLDYGRMNLWATLFGALFCFPAGRWLDRFGARCVLPVVLTALGLTVVAMSFVGTPATLFWSITLTRGLGQSALSVVSISLVGKSFDRRNSWPMAAYAVLLSVGFMIAFPTVQYFVAAAGWRRSWEVVGWTLVGLAPIAVLVLLGMPRQANSHGPSSAAGLGEGTAPADGLTLAEALATPIFWVFAAAVSLFGLAYSGLGLFNEDVLAERGLAEHYGGTLAASAIVGLLGQSLCGLLAKRWSYSRLTTMAMIVYALGLVMLSRAVGVIELYAATALLGASGGMITVVFFAAWSRTFGRRELGRIQGVAQTLSVLASAVGPLAFAASRSYLGSYFTVLDLLAACVALLGTAAWFVSPPRGEAGAADAE